MNVDGHFDGKYQSRAPVIVNETALSFMGIDNPIGKKIDLGYSMWNGYIAGVVSDFHFKPLNNKIAPMAIVYDPESFLEMFIRINPENKSETIAYIEEVTGPYRKDDYLFDYYFVKDKMDVLYKAEKNMSGFAYIFAFISVSLSFIGILGMVSYLIRRRRKGIAIRKVFGAETANIIYLFAKEAFVIVGISSLVSSLLAWYFLNGWLQNYAYHINLTPVLFISVFIIAMLAIILTTIALVYGEANKDPVENLKYE